MPLKKHATQPQKKRLRKTERFLLVSSFIALCVLLHGTCVKIWLVRLARYESKLSELRLGNLAIAPLCDSASYCVNEGYVAFLRASNTTSRWGDLNLLGHMKPGGTIAQPLMDNSLTGVAHKNYISTQVVDQIENKLFLGEASVPRRQRSREPSLIPETFCLIRDFQLRDARIFRRSTWEGDEICSLTIHGPDPQGNPSVVCLENAQHTEAFKSWECPVTVRITPIPEEFAGRNIVPLVKKNHYHATYKIDALWVLDLMGSPEDTPRLFPLDFHSKSINLAKQHAYFLADCDHLSGWRGSVPVIQVSELLWVTLGHMQGIEKPTRSNPLGRTYSYRFIQLLSDFPGEPPRRCVKDDDDEYFLQNLPRPFVFLVGFVHVGRYMRGPFTPVERFMITGAVDDRTPFMTTVDLRLHLPENAF
jgi:hypothetical protein